jgi:hypothetical protein
MGKKRILNLGVLIELIVLLFFSEKSTSIGEHFSALASCSKTSEKKVRALIIFFAKKSARFETL